MDKIEKGLRKFSKKERIWIKDILEKIITGNISDLDLKRLRGREDIFRIRRGKIRILFRKTGTSVFILAIERRNETTYKDL